MNGSRNSNRGDFNIKSKTSDLSENTTIPVNKSLEDSDDSQEFWKEIVKTRNNQNENVAESRVINTQPNINKVHDLKLNKFRKSQANGNENSKITKNTKNTNDRNLPKTKKNIHHKSCTTNSNIIIEPHHRISVDSKARKFSSENRFELLHQQAIDKLNKHTKLKQESEKSKQMKEIEECTFSPVINKTRISEDYNRNSPADFIQRQMKWNKEVIVK